MIKTMKISYQMICLLFFMRLHHFDAIEEQHSYCIIGKSISKSILQSVIKHPFRGPIKWSKFSIIGVIIDEKIVASQLKKKHAKT